MYKLFKDLVHYGDIVDDEQKTIKGAYVRITKFDMQGERYTVYQVNGELIDIRKEGLL